MRPFALWLSFAAPVLAAQAGPQLTADLQARLERAATERSAPGASAAVVLPDGNYVTMVHGADAAGAALRPDTKFMSGSIGKTYCAAIALQLVQEKLLSLDGPVQAVLGGRDWYARVPNAGTITLRHLLQHTSGVPDHVWKKPFQREVAQAGDRALTPEQCVAYVLGDEPVAPAGERFAYADTNYVLVGLCIEEVTGKSFGAVLHERVLEPLLLHETVWNDRRDLPDLACGLAGGIGFWKGPTVDDGKYFTNPAFEYCGGGISSTPRDLARWLRALFAGDVVPEPLRAEHVKAMPAGRAVGGGYGLGCFVGSSPHGPAFGHSGVMPGYLSYALWYPDLQCAVAVQFPTDDGKQVGDMRELCHELAGLAKAQLPSPARK